MPEAIRHSPRSVPPARRVAVRAAVAAACLLARQPPGRIRAVLTWLRRGSRPATFAQAAALRRDVEAVSLRCAGREGCLPRSLATVLLGRAGGRWATWCVGVRRIAPFGAHAWVEAEGIAVGESYPPGYFVVLFTVPSDQDR
ncbi:lasso peptide biosynthesis B2 protein [Thermoactinospora rubra]|uniref:lasso peptide biosynthesis B2 protein n=1 Tax=Thermoactinospora rubra TaxID=1088767 RepID=UPI001982089D|nr:lasso peptide biosynthesis B2 protein [Thermoactinospora rubra]